MKSNNDYNNSLSVSFGGFYGPLNLLISMIYREKVDIFDISIREISNRYVVLSQEDKLKYLEQTGNFYLSTSLLLLIKSNTLINNRNNEDIDPIDYSYLIDRIIGYQKYKKLATVLKQRVQPIIFPIGYGKIVKKNMLTLKYIYINRVNPNRLQEIFMHAYAEFQRKTSLVISDSITVKYKMLLIDDKIRRFPRFLLQDILPTPSSKFDLICTLLALLEKTRMRSINMKQEKIFGPIWIHCV